MSSLLEAVNTSLNKIEVTDQLPTKVGDVSIMTIGELFNALEIFHGEDDTNEHIDPSCGYNTSQFYVYGIAGGYGENSTIENLKAVGLDWYRQYNKPTRSLSTFISNGKTVFGGPLESVYLNGWHYLFYYYHTVCGVYLSDRSGWSNEVDSSVYVAVVRAHE